MKKTNSKGISVSIINILSGVGIVVLLLITITFVMESWGLNPRLMVAYPVSDEQYSPEGDLSCGYIGEFTLNPSAGEGTYNFDVDRFGNFYLTNPALNEVYIYDKNGNRTKTFTTAGKFGAFSYPTSVAVDKDGNIYVADSANNRILKFSNGVWTEWATRGGIRYKDPVQVIAEGNYIYVMENSDGTWAEGDSHVFKLNRDNGNLLATIGEYSSSKSGNGEYRFPVYIDFDATGDLFLVDISRAKIMIYAQDGTFKSEWGEEGGGDGQISGPTSISFKFSDGSVYVTEIDNKRVSHFTKDGTWIENIGEGGVGDPNDDLGEARDSYIDDINKILYVMYFDDYGVMHIKKYSLNVCGKITIKKDVVGGTSTQGFEFTRSFGNNFILIDDTQGEATFEVPTSGTYNVTENVPSNWKLNKITCTDPTGDTVVAGATATIKLKVPEEVECVFEDEAIPQGKIIIEKITSPLSDIETEFIFTPSANLGGGDFKLKDKGSKNYLNVQNGRYTIKETKDPQYGTLNIVCTDPTRNTQVNNGTGVATINVDKGETVKCKYTNIYGILPDSPKDSGLQL